MMLHSFWLKRLSFERIPEPPVSLGADMAVLGRSDIDVCYKLFYRAMHASWGKYSRAAQIMILNEVYVQWQQEDTRASQAPPRDDGHYA